MSRLKVQLGEWYTELRRALGVVHREGYAPELGDVVVPVYPLSNPNVVNNVATFADSFTDLDQSFMGYHQQAAVVGQFGDVQIFNPVGSGKDVWIDYVKTNVQAQIRVSAGVFAGGAAATGTGKLMGGSAPVAELRAQATAGGSGTQVGYQIAGGAVEQYFEPPIKLPPGSGIHWEADVANVTIIAAFQWRETNA